MGKKQRQRNKANPQMRTVARVSLFTRAKQFVIGLAPLVLLMAVVRVALAEPYHIPSGSMTPTLLEGDWLYVNKLRFGGHLPLTQINLPGYASPRRRDVAVFVSPPQDLDIRITPGDVTPTLVKRIVGVAGDTLFMRRGELFVNGVREVPVLPVDTADQQYPIEFFRHELALVVRGSRFGEAPASPTLHEWGPIVVPANMFFMLGDNRDSSVDSRFYGPVPRANIRGTPMFVYYSYDTRNGAPFLRAITHIRWKRIATVIK